MKVTRNIDTGDEKQTIRTISTKPKEHFEGRWKSGRLYPLYSVVVNNGTTFISQNAKMKEEPYVIYDADKKEFKAPDGWLIKEMSADSRVTALGGGGEGGVTPEEVEEMIKDKVDKVGGKGLSTNDYDNTEKNKVASAYQKPDNGIPKSDLAKAVQDVLDDADGAYKMPVTGIPFADLADGVQDSLSNADAAYQKPSSGVPKTDLASGVQDSLDLADTSVQAEPVGPIIAPPETDDFATKTSVEEIEAKVDNITGTILEGSSTPYPANTVFMQYPQVKPGDVVYMTLKNTNGAAQAVQFYDTNDTSLGSSYIYGWGGGGVLDEEKSYVIKIPNNYGYAKTLWGHGIAILHLSRFSGTIVDEILNSEEHSDFRDDLLDEMKVGNNPGVNLIDPNAPDTRIGYYLKPNNEFVSNADYNTTGFVPVVAGSTYYSGARAGQMRFVNYYDSDKNYLSNAEYVNSFTAPVNCAFVRITFYSDNWAYVQISKDSQKPYEPYSPIDGYLNTNPKIQQIDKQVNDLMIDITTVPAWVNGNFSVSAGTISYTSYNNRARFNTPMALAPGESVKVTTIHADADIICAFIQDGVATQLNANWADLCEFTAEQACTFIVQAKVGDLTSFYNDIASYVKVEKTTLKGAVSKLMSGTAESTDIVSLNDKKRVAIPILSNLARAYKLDSTTGRKPLVLLHFSDIHANAGNLSRIASFLSEYSDYIDGAISTGDVLSMKYDQTSIWGDAPEDMLNVIGNHDCQTQDSTDPNVVGVSPFSNSWYLVSPTIPYDKFIKPYVDNWGVTQPVDAETEGKLYYYKDYSTEKVRLIVVDGNYWDATQKSWLETTLAGAKTAGLSVLIASHYSAFASTRQPSNPFDSLDADTTVPMNVEVATAVKDFMDSDGDFICYIGGHRHADIFGLGISFPEQLQILVNTASDVAELQNDTARVAGTKSQDLFNIIAIDTESKLIKVWRVGADYDRYGRFKGTLCWKYDTRTLIKS